MLLIRRNGITLPSASQDVCCSKFSQTRLFGKGNLWSNFGSLCVRSSFTAKHFHSTDSPPSVPATNTGKKQLQNAPLSERQPDATIKHSSTSADTLTSDTPVFVDKRIPRSVQRMSKKGVTGVARAVLIKGALMPDGVREMLATLICLVFACVGLVLYAPYWGFANKNPEITQDSMNMSAHKQQDDIRSYRMIPVYEDPDTKTKIKYYKKVRYK